MNKLIIDTTDAKKTTIKLLSDKRTDEITQVNIPKSQIALILIDKLIRRNKINPADLDEIEVNTNPGSFTGTRVGIAIANALGFGKKRKVGHELWIGCMQNDPKSWKEMERYNKQDVKLLEAVYDKLLPWIKDHANYNLYGSSSLVCPNCGSANHQRRGIAITRTLRYTRHQCKDCGTWFRGAKSQGPKPTEKFIQI